MVRIIPWLLTIYLYSPVFYSLYKNRWDTIDYTHAYFILPLSLLVVWTKRHEIKKCVSGPPNNLFAVSFTGFSLLILGLSMFILGWRWDYLFISTLSLIPFLFGMCLFLYNRDLARTLVFPVLYLLLLVPIPIGVLDGITLPMRHMASVLSAGILSLMRYDIIREGLLINMGGHEIFMGAPCSGFRSLITMASLSLIYIYFTNGRTAKNAILFMSIIPPSPYRKPDAYHRAVPDHLLFRRNCRPGVLPQLQWDAGILDYYLWTNGP